MKIRGCRFAISAMLLIMLAMGAATAQQCSSSITMCGCTITSPGDYTVDADLNAAQGLTSRGGCIDVAAKGVRLLTNGFPISGAGTGSGIGIHLLSSAKDVFLEGWVGGPRSALFGWKNGLESEASNVIADTFGCFGNTTGVLLKGAQNNNINRFEVSGSFFYGVWITGGSRNQINGLSADANVIAVYVGCGLGQECKEDEETSHGNFIYNSYVPLSQLIGIAIEHGSKRNTMTNNFVNAFQYDLFDGNPSCDGNLWRFNQFTRAVQPCIQ